MRRLLKTLPLTFGVASLCLLAASCGGSDHAQARFVNAIPNTSVYGGGLDLEVNGTKDFTNITFPTVSASTYTSVASGNDTFLGVQTGTTTQVFSSTASLGSGDQYTVVATGFAGGSGSGVVFLSLPDNNTAPATGDVEFRFIEASPSGPPSVDIYVEPNPANGFSGTPTVSALAFQQASGYISLPYNSAGSGYTIYVTPSGSGIADFSQTINNPTGSIRTFVLTDEENVQQLNDQMIELDDLL